MVDNNINFCNKCSRWMMDLDVESMMSFFDFDFDVTFLPFFGFFKLKKVDCFHCKKFVVYATMNDLFDDDLFFNGWHMYFVNFSFEKLFSIDSLDSFIFVFDLEKMNMVYNVKSKLSSFNFFSVQFVDWFDLNNVNFFLKWYDNCKLIPGHLVMKDLYLLQVKLDDYEDKKFMTSLNLIDFEQGYMNLLLFSHLSMIFKEFNSNLLLYDICAEVCFFFLRVTHSFYVLVSKQSFLFSMSNLWDFDLSLSLHKDIYSHVKFFNWEDFDYNSLKFYFDNIELDLDTLYYEMKYVRFRYSYKNMEELSVKKQKMLAFEEYVSKEKETYLAKKSSNKKNDQKFIDMELELKMLWESFLKQEAWFKAWEVEVASKKEIEDESMFKGKVGSFNSDEIPFLKMKGFGMKEEVSEDFGLSEKEKKSKEKKESSQMEKEESKSKEWEESEAKKEKEDEEKTKFNDEWVVYFDNEKQEFSDDDYNFK